MEKRTPPIGGMSAPGPEPSIGSETHRPHSYSSKGFPIPPSQDNQLRRVGEEVHWTLWGIASPSESTAGWWLVRRLLPCWVK